MSMFLGIFCLMASLAKPAAAGFVYTERGRRLGVSDIGEGGANGNGILAVDNSGSNFGFGSRGHDIGNNIGKGEYGAIDGRFTRRGLMSNRGTIAKEVIAAGAASKFGLG